MAKVISWQIAGKFVYITPQHGSYILDSQISESERTALKNEAKNWNLQAYTTRFQSMYQAVENMWGTTDLNPNASFYYNALQGEGVYMIGGADGVNTADYGKPFYNLIIENNNTSVGLGGDYVLDKRTDLYTKIYLERNGAFFAPPASDISIVDEVGTTASFSTETVSENGIAKTQIKLTIPANTQFDEDYPIKEYTITVVKGDSYTGKTVFTVVGVKDGEEGASYDLVVKPRQIKVTADGDVSNEAVTCSAVRNGIEVINDNGTKLVDELNLQIKYDFGTITDDVDDISNVYRGGISYQDIAENGDQVNFYLIFNGRYLVDSDSCTISRDGKDNGTLKLELDNEMDGISVGSDTKLDISEPVTSSTGFVLYSGGTELEILNSGQNKVKVENLGQNASWAVYGNENNTGTVEGKKKGWIKFTLNDQFDFGEDYKDSVKITVWGQNDHGEIASATTNYLIMGIRGGKDGEVFKIIPNLDVILCDPNNADTPYVGSETHLTAEAYIGTERIENAEITYSLDVTYGNAYTQTAHLPAAGLDIADLITGASYVALYLWTGDTSNPGRRILVDRETVPIMWQGADGSAAWVELGNEIDAISVGWDTDLDLDDELSSVTVGTTVRVISGDTPIQIQNIRIIAPNGKEGHWSTYTERSWDWNNGQGNDEDNDNGTHTIARIFITLLDGFDFDEDLREQATIAVTAGTQDNPWHGYAHYVIKGIPGGKDGYVYRLAPEVDYINFHPNEGHEGTLDFGESNISCDAYYGSTLLDPSSDDPEVNFGTIYYSFNKICTSTGDTETGGYVTGMTIYPSGGVEIDGLITRNNYTNFKYLVFYLVVDGEIVDRETIPIIADGVNGHDSVYIELTNEIDSIGTDTDSKLDLPVGESRKASTGIILHSGSTHLRITNVSGVLSQNTSANPNTYTTGGTIEETSGLTAEFWVEMFNGFEFGSDLKEKAIITVRGTNDDTEEQVSASATFVIAAIKGAKDGVTYKIQPTPDELVYDMATQKWAGNYSNVFAYAYANGKKMSEQGYRVGVDYEVKTASVIWDLDVATQRWSATDSSLSNYTEGSGVGFATPASPNAREQVIAFYLAVKIGNVWTAVDRETVSLRISGKDGENGTSSPSFDLTNPIEVITTGDNDILEVEGATGVTVTTTVKGKMGSTPAPINVSVPQYPYSLCTASTSNNGSNEVTVTVKLKNNFSFAKTSSLPAQKRTITITASFASDPSITDTLTFTIKSIRQPNVPEGQSYKLKTNVPSVVFDGTEYSPTSLTAAMFLGGTKIDSCIYAVYSDSPLTLEQATARNTYSSYNDTPMQKWTFSINGGILNMPSSVSANGYIYVGAFSANGEFYDYDDIPVTFDSDSSLASGIIADLTDDVGVVATGENKRLEANTELATTATVRNGFDPLVITGMKISYNDTVHDMPWEYTDAHGGKIRFAKGSLNAREVDITATVTASESNYIDFEGENPLQFKIVMTADTLTDPVEVKTGYSILGLQGGKDGNKFKLVLNADQVFYDANKPEGERFAPSAITAKIFLEDENLTSRENVSFEIKNSDPEDDSGTELWLDNGVYDSVNEQYVFALSETQYSEFEPLTIRAMSGNTVMDWETVQVLRDGKDGVGGIELKFENSPYEVEQVDANKVTTEQVTIRGYATLHSGSTLVPITALELLPSPQSDYDASKLTFSSGVTDNDNTNGAYIEVVLASGYDFSAGATSLRVAATGNTGTDTVARKATFVITEKLGGKGDRGPKTRIRDWSDETAVDYQNGSEQDAFWDIVYYHNDSFGGYFGCKQDQSAGTSKRAPSVVDGVGQSDDYWEYYPDYDFVATKVMSIGEWPNGWVIDKGKIQHTNSSITLTSNGEVTVSVPSTKYLAYSNSSDGIVYLDGAEKYSDGEKVIAYRLHTGTAQSGDIKIDNNHYLRVDDSKNYVYDSGNIKVDKSVVNIGCYISCEKDLLDAMESMDPVVYLSSPSTLSDPFFARIKISDNSYTYIYKFEPNSKIGSYVSKTSLLLSSSLRLGRQYATEELYPPGYDEDLPGGDISGDPVFPVNPDLPPLEPDLPTYTKRTITAFNLCETEDGLGKTYIQETKDSVVNRVYTRQYGTSLYFKFDSSVSFGTTATAASDIYSRSTSNDEEIDTNKVSFKIQSVDYEHVNDTPILTVGYPEGDRIYSWKSGNKTIYTKVPYATDYAYNIDGEPLDDVKAVDGNQIMYDGEYYEYYSDVVLSSSQKDKFAFTKIYGDGRVVTDKLVAFGGEFKGNVKATNGIFNGEVNATHGTLTGVTIVNAANIGGNISMSGSNKFSMTDATGIQRILFSNTDIEPGQYVGGSSSINLGFHEEYHDYMKSATLWTTFSNTWTKKVFDIFLYAGDKIGGMLAITFKLTDCHESASEIWVYGELQKGAQFGGRINYTASNVSNGSRTIYVHIGKTSNMADTTNSTSENSITIGTGNAGPGQYTLELRVGGKFRKNTWGNIAYFDVGITSEIKVERGTGTGGGTTDQVNKFLVGPNGIAHVTREGGVFSSVSNASGSTSLSMFSDTNTSGVHQNGIYIDKNEFKMVYDGSVYRAVTRTIQYRTTGGSYAEGQFLMFIPS